MERSSVKRSRALRLVFVAGALIVLLLFALFVPSSLWEQDWAVLGLVTALTVVGAHLFPGGALCWPNVFLVLLTLFHLGYLLLVKHALVPANPHMPGIDAPHVPLAFQLFAVACIAFALGAAVAGFIPVGSPPPRDPPDSSAVLVLGLAVSGFGIMAFLLYVGQVGGPVALLNSSYGAYWSFLNNGDPRLGTMAFHYLPAGLLVLYGAVRRFPEPLRLRLRIPLVVAFLSFTMLLLWLGNRGSAFLSAVALLYVHHLWYKKFNALHVGLLCGVVLLTIPVVAQLRNIDPSHRRLALDSVETSPLDGIAEMGGAIRPYLAFLDLFGESRVRLERLGWVPYRAALADVIPNLSSRKSADESEGYVRADTWITQQVDRVAADEGFGLGSSPIGEAFAAYGTTGVIVTFLVLGCGIAYLERFFAEAHSYYGMAAVGLLFYSLNWFVRDDIFGLVRPVIWALILLGLTRAAQALLGTKGGPFPLTQHEQDLAHQD